MIINLPLVKHDFTTPSLLPFHPPNIPIPPDVRTGLTREYFFICYLTHSPVYQNDVGVTKENISNYKLLQNKIIHN